MLREDSERELIETAVVALRPFGDAEELLLAGGQEYRLEKPDRILVRLKVKHSGFGTLNNQGLGSKFVEEAHKPSDSELRWLTQYFIFYILGK